MVDLGVASDPNGRSLVRGHDFGACSSAGCAPASMSEMTELEWRRARESESMPARFSGSNGRPIARTMADILEDAAADE